MKKLLLFATMLGIGAAAQAQTRLALYEEFTGENCGPCAATNPGFDALVLTTANASKIQVIKYQVPIPSAGTILYPQAKVYSDARRAYYSVSSAPNGKIDGATSSPSSGSPGHPYYFSQAEIDAEAAVTTPFTMTVTAAWDATYSNILATINVTAVSAYSGSGSVYLRTALVQSVDYCTPPGTNGETHFSNVVRSMYPDATGTSVAASWPAGTTQTYNFTIPVPNYVDKSTAPYVVVWIQSDGDKKIAQSAKSTALSKVPNDLATACPITGISCISGTTGSVTHKVALENKGTSAVSSADIYYKLGTGAYTKYTWTGSLAVGGTTTVTMPGVTTGAGTATFTDSVVLAGDQNNGNNVVSSNVSVVSTSGASVPIATDFESGLPTGFLFYDSDGSGNTWINGYGGTGSTYCHSGIYMPWYKLSSYPSGSSSMMLVPTPVVSSGVKLEFWEAYAQNSSSNNDKLEVVYSTNCGTSWTALWSASGSAHATTSPTTTYWLPSRTSSTDWVKRSVSLATLPANAIVGIRATAAGGNNLFIDDVNIGTTGISEDLFVENSVNIAPNPANTFANLTFSLESASHLNITIVDVLGKVVATVSDADMSAGQQQITINTSDLAAGTYLVKMTSDKGTTTQKLSVVR